MAADASMAIEAYRGLGGLASLAEDWSHLAAQLARPRICHGQGWWRAYLETLEPDPDSLHFFLFRDALGPVAILPMQYRVVRWMGLPRRELAFPEHAHLPFHDMLLRPGADLPALLQGLRSSLGRGQMPDWDLMRFGPVLAESPLAGLDEEQFEIKALSPCAYFVCEPPFERMVKGFSKNFQANLKKAHNRWAKVHGARYFSTVETDEVERGFSEFLRIEAAGWKGLAGSGTAIALDPSLEAFYHRLIMEFAPNRRVRLNCLAIDGQVIAAHFCLIEGDTLYLLKMAYDEQHAHLSPGNVLLDHVLRDGVEQGGFRYLNLVADMEWHSDWLPAHYEVRRIRSFNSTPVGRLSRLKSTGKSRLKPLYHAMRAALMRADVPGPGQADGFKTRTRSG